MRSHRVKTAPADASRLRAEHAERRDDPQQQVWQRESARCGRLHRRQLRHRRRLECQRVQDFQRHVRRRAARRRDTAYFPETAHGEAQKRCAHQLRGQRRQLPQHLRQVRHRRVFVTYLSACRLLVRLSVCLSICLSVR